MSELGTVICGNCGRPIFRGERRYRHAQFGWEVHPSCLGFDKREEYMEMTALQKEGPNDAKSETGTTATE